MRNNFGRLISMGLIAIALTATTRTTRGDEPRLAEYFGFLPLEIYKLDSRIQNLAIGDLDGDKIDDVAIVNNGRSRIDLLLSTKASDDEESPKTEANQVPSDRRMRLKSLPVNKEVVSLKLGDLNHDGKVDIAYYGTPSELIVLYNQGNAKFGDQRRLNVGEAIESPTALAVGDFNRDGRDDLALLGPNEIVTVLQTDAGKLGDPERLPHTASRPGILSAVDIDGDGGDDLAILDGGSDDPIRIRFSTEAKQLGPEQRFAVETPRAIAFADLDGKKGAEMIGIENQSGRVKVYTLDDAGEDEAGKRGRLLFYPLPSGNTRGRSLAVGDLNGDQKADVVVTDPASAQFFVYLQEKGGLGPLQTFPGLVGGKVVKAADLDGDGKAEVVVLSEQEKQVATSKLENGRLRFPAPLPIVGEPVALEIADLDGDKTPEILYIARESEEGSSKDAYKLRALQREQSGKFVPFRWAQTDSATIKGLSGGPSAMHVLDINHDDRPDVLIFHSSRTPVLLLGHPEGEPPQPAVGGLGPLVGIASTGISLRTPGGPGLLVAQNTFARNIELDKSGQWRIKDQYNSGRGSAQIIGAAALDTDGDKKAEVVLLDRSSKSLLFLDPKDGVYRPGGTLSIGTFDFQATHVADLDGDGTEDLLLAGTEKFGVVLTGRKGQRLRPLASYESNRKDAHLGDLIAADINHDGRPDLILTDVTEHFIELVTFVADRNELERALNFKIFEKKSFRERGSLIEPRDLAVGDVNGDGRTDLVLIVHDRVLIYRQDPGTRAKSSRTAEKTADSDVERTSGTKP